MISLLHLFIYLLFEVNFRSRELIFFFATNPVPWDFIIELRALIGVMLSWFFMFCVLVIIFTSVVVDISSSLIRGSW